MVPKSLMKTTVGEEEKDRRGIRRMNTVNDALSADMFRRRAAGATDCRLEAGGTKFITG